VQEVHGVLAYGEGLATEIKPELLGAFKYWYHVSYRERRA